MTGENHSVEPKPAGTPLQAGPSSMNGSATLATANSAGAGTSQFANSNFPFWMRPGGTMGDTAAAATMSSASAKHSQASWASQASKAGLSSYSMHPAAAAAAAWASAMASSGLAPGVRQGGAGATPSPSLPLSMSTPAGAPAVEFSPSPTPSSYQLPVQQHPQQPNHPQHQEQQEPQPQQPQQPQQHELPPISAAQHERERSATSNAAAQQAMAMAAAAAASRGLYGYDWSLEAAAAAAAAAVGAGGIPGAGGSGTSSAVGNGAAAHGGGRDLPTMGAWGSRLGPQDRQSAASAYHHASSHEGFHPSMLAQYGMPASLQSRGLSGSGSGTLTTEGDASATQVSSARPSNTSSLPEVPQDAPPSSSSVPGLLRGQVHGSNERSAPPRGAGSPAAPSMDCLVPGMGMPNSQLMEAYIASQFHSMPLYMRSAMMPRSSQGPGSTIAVNQASVAAAAAAAAAAASHGGGGHHSHHLPLNSAMVALRHNAAAAMAQAVAAQHVALTKQGQMSLPLASNSGQPPLKRAKSDAEPNGLDSRGTGAVDPARSGASGRPSKGGRRKGSLSRKWGDPLQLHVSTGQEAAAAARTWKDMKWCLCYKNGSSIELNGAYLVYGCADHSQAAVASCDGRRQCVRHSCPVHLKLQNIDGTFVIREEQGVSHLPVWVKSPSEEPAIAPHLILRVRELLESGTFNPISIRHQLVSEIQQGLLKCPRNLPTAEQIQELVDTFNAGSASAAASATVATISSTPEASLMKSDPTDRASSSVEDAGAAGKDNNGPDSNPQTSPARDENAPLAPAPPQESDATPQETSAVEKQEQARGEAGDQYPRNPKDDAATRPSTDQAPGESPPNLAS